MCYILTMNNALKILPVDHFIPFILNFLGKAVDFKLKTIPAYFYYNLWNRRQITDIDSNLSMFKSSGSDRIHINLKACE